MLHVCPTSIVCAPAERVWTLVTTARELARWSDTRVIDAPARELRSGDRLVLGAGFLHLARVVFHVQDVVRFRRLALRIQLPLGVTNDEVIEISPAGDDACRVTFN